MKQILDCRPDFKAFLEKHNLKTETLEMLGIDIKNLKTLKDLTDLQMVIKALEGESSAKSYIDEQYDREASIEALNNAIEPGTLVVHPSKFE
jgi:hypothetical protein